jgi:beta-mannanase
MKVISRIVALSASVMMASGVVLAANQPDGTPPVGAQTEAHAVDKRPIISNGSIDFGAYDPYGDFGSDPNVKFEHLFLPWEDVDLSSLATADEYASSRGRELLITVEPWSWSADWRLSPDQLLNGIMAGAYDANMAAICSAAANFKSTVIIRWAQEMDETDNQFTWSHWSPASYVAAYQKMITVCRKSNHTAKFMWSPKGNPSLTKYYPGDSFVDIVGLSVFGLQQYDKDNFGKERSFAEILEPGYRLAQRFGKPIMVAELGYQGDLDYVTRWRQTVLEPNPEFSNLSAILYFDDREVHAWPKGYGFPDWRVNSILAD